MAKSIIKAGFSELKHGNVFRSGTLELGNDLWSAKHIFNVEEVIEPGKFTQINGRCLPQVKTSLTPYIV